MSKLWRINKDLSKRLIIKFGMSENVKKGINKKFTSVVITVVAVVTYILCESGVIPNV